MSDVPLTPEEARRAAFNAHQWVDSFGSPTTFVCSCGWTWTRDERRWDDVWLDHRLDAVDELLRRLLEEARTERDRAVEETLLLAESLTWALGALREADDPAVPLPDEYRRAFALVSAPPQPRGDDA